MFKAYNWWHVCGGILVMYQGDQGIKLGDQRIFPFLWWETKNDLNVVVWSSYILFRTRSSLLCRVCRLTWYVNPLTCEWAHVSDLFIDLAAWPFLYTCTIKIIIVTDSPVAKIRPLGNAWTYRSFYATYKGPARSWVWRFPLMLASYHESGWRFDTKKCSRSRDVLSCSGQATQVVVRTELWAPTKTWATTKPFKTGFVYVQFLSNDPLVKKYVWNLWNLSLTSQ